MPVRREDVQDLVKAHSELEDPLETAIWIRPGDTEACLVEIVPSMVEDEHPERAVLFNPGISFRFPVRLWVGNRRDIERALATDPALARDVAAGEILYGNDAGEQIKALAARIANGRLS